MFPAFLAGFGPKLLTFLLRLGFGGAVDKVLDLMEQRASTETERQRIRTQATIAAIQAGVNQYLAEQETRRQLAAEGTARQSRKMNYTVFWVIIVAALGPGVLTMWSLWAYNIFFWSDGIWPQDWSIAEFPPQSARWVNMSIEWLFDPYGVGSTVGTATLAGWVAGKRL
jgi:hypothetical protein